MTQAKPNQLYKPEDGTSCRRYILTIDHAIGAAQTDRFFDTLMSNLLPGDEITVKQFDIVGDDMAKSTLLARQDFEIVSLDHAERRVNIVVRGDVVTFASASKAADPVDGAGKPVIKWNAGKKAHQVLLGDNVLFESADKSEAQAFLEAA